MFLIYLEKLIEEIKALITTSNSSVSTISTNTGTSATNTGNLVGCSVAGSATGAITASDSTTYDPPLRCIWATGAGNITVMLSGDSTNTVVIPVTAKERVSEFLIKKVMATGTTATGISGAR